MHSVKRIEIMASSFEQEKILDGLRKAKVPEYTVIPNLLGKLPEEEMSDDLVSNVYVLAFCLPDQIKPTMEIIRPILNKFGGVCYISDAMEIRSVRCVASL
jgi:nitrogen regulatory protein PII